MIPLRDSSARHRLTPANTLLIAANVAVFGYEIWLGPQDTEFMARLALVPATISAKPPAVGIHGDPLWWPPLTLITSLFLHAGLLHLAGNMLYLFVFGAAVEERMGSGRFLSFYLLAGIAAGLAMVVSEPGSRTAVIGASGAVAGVLGGYFIFYPRGRILTLLPLFIIIYFVEIPALFYLLLWFAAQLYAGLYSNGPAGAAGGVAWWAHVGGFLFGVAVAPLMGRARR